MGEALRAAILAACDAVEGAREALCELDAPTGDGDHGVTMTIGARGVRRQLDATTSDDPVAIVRAAALGMAGAGGAIGPIYGRGLLAVAGALTAVDVTGPDGAVAALARCAGAAEKAVAELGHARPGDKTLLDALGPTAAALADADRSGAPLGEALHRARAAARAGAEATTGMVATVGRSARFGERSRGSTDPGATSFALIVDALVASVLGSAVPMQDAVAGSSATAAPSARAGSGDG